MSLQRISAFFRSYLFIRIVFNLVFLYVWIKGTANNFNHSGVTGDQRMLLLYHAIGYNALLLFSLYINTLVFIPQFLLKKKYLVYTLGLLFSLLLHTAVIVFYREYITDLIPGVKSYDFSYYSAFNRSTREDTFRFFLYIFYHSSCFFIIPFSLIFLGQHFFIVIRQNELIQQQQNAIELSMLKSQINPHFLFNVLNSIYSLSLSKSDQTPEVVMRLSEILRYMLYEAKQESVLLEKEIQMLRDYVDIEKMRLSKLQELRLECDELLPPYPIAPLLLIPFAENAVKHGTNSLAEGAFAHIDIRINGGRLHFTCRNNYKPLPAQEHSGLGLENVRKRLQLLYPGRHILEISRQKNIFEVSLSIQLAYEMPDR